MKTSFQRERLLWMSFTVVLLFASLFGITRARNENRQFQRDMEFAMIEQGKSHRKLQELKHELKVTREGVLTPAEKRYLSATRHVDPLAMVTGDLKKRNSLIPHKGVLGGTFGFHGSNIHILGSRWVYARFDDGHVQGKILLRYKILKTGHVQWTVLDSYLEN